MEHTKTSLLKLYVICIDWIKYNLFLSKLRRDSLLAKRNDNYQLIENEQMDWGVPYPNYITSMPKLILETVITHELFESLLGLFELLGGEFSWAGFFWLVGIPKLYYYASHVVGACSVRHRDVSLRDSLVHHFLDNKRSLSCWFWLL